MQKLGKSPHKWFLAAVLMFAFLLLMLAFVSLQQGSSAGISPSSSSDNRLLPPLHSSQDSSAAPGYCLNATTCSEGLTDYGILSNGKTYSYKAPAVNSSTTIAKLSLGTGNGERYAISLQQNSVAWNVLENSNYGEYWVQDVVDIVQSGSSYVVDVFNNIWNFSNSHACCMNGTVYGCGGSFSNEVYYGCSGPSFEVKLPFKVVLGDNASLGSNNSESSCIGFLYQVWHGSKELGSGQWDKVCFASDFKASKAPYYLIGGFNPYTYNALQIAIAGWCCGYTGQVKAINASLQLDYEKARGNWVSVPHAWSDCDTGETVTGVRMSSSRITHVGKASHGTDNQVQLW